MNAWWQTATVLTCYLPLGGEGPWWFPNTMTSHAYPLYSIPCPSLFEQCNEIAHWDSRSPLCSSLIWSPFYRPWRISSECRLSLCTVKETTVDHSQQGGDWNGQWMLKSMSSCLVHLGFGCLNHGCELCLLVCSIFVWTVALESSTGLNKQWPYLIYWIYYAFKSALLR